MRKREDIIEEAWPHRGMHEDKKEEKKVNAAALSIIRAFLDKQPTINYPYGAAAGGLLWTFSSLKQFWKCAGGLTKKGW
jgi:hypothetical protein